MFIRILQTELFEKSVSSKKFLRVFSINHVKLNLVVILTFAVRWGQFFDSRKFWSSFTVSVITVVPSSASKSADCEDNGIPSHRAETWSIKLILTIIASRFSISEWGVIYQNYECPMYSKTFLLLSYSYFYSFTIIQQLDMQKFWLYFAN